MCKMSTPLFLPLPLPAIPISLSPFPCPFVFVWLVLTVLDGANFGALLLEALAHLGLGHARAERLGDVALDGLEEVAKLLLLVLQVLLGAVRLDGLLHDQLVLLGLGVHARVDLVQDGDAHWCFWLSVWRGWVSVCGCVYGRKRERGTRRVVVTLHNRGGMLAPPLGPAFWKTACSPRFKRGDQDTQSHTPHATRPPPTPPQALTGLLPYLRSPWGRRHGKRCRAWPGRPRGAGGRPRGRRNGHA